MLAEYEAAAGLLAQLRALGSGPLWPHEAATLAVPRPPSERSITTAVSAFAALHCQETPNATELSVAPGLLLLDVTEVTTCTCGPSSMPRISVDMLQLVALMAALPFEAGLRVQWAAHALHWALSASSPHLASRSHQVTT